MKKSKYLIDLIWRYFVGGEGGLLGVSWKKKWSRNGYTKSMTC